MKLLVLLSTMVLSVSAYAEKNPLANKSFCSSNSDARDVYRFMSDGSVEIVYYEYNESITSFAAGMNISTKTPYIYKVKGLKLETHGSDHRITMEGEKDYFTLKQNGDDKIILTLSNGDVEKKELSTCTIPHLDDALFDEEGVYDYQSEKAKAELELIEALLGTIK